MPLFRLSEVKEQLQKLDHYPRKALSQNFLIDGNVLKKILNAASIKKGDKALEIGPGLGVLTQALLQAGCSVTAIEKDARLAEHIRSYFNEQKDLRLIENDFLDIDLTSVLSGPETTKVVANIPYKITGLIIKRLIMLPEQISCIVLMVQKEFAERLTATPGEKNYSSFTLMTEIFAKSEVLFTVSASCFYPAPSVDSAVIRLTPKKPELDVDTEFLLTMIHTAFSQRRKKLTSSLKGAFGKENVEKALKACNLSMDTRPQELSLKQFGALGRNLQSTS